MWLASLKEWTELVQPFHTHCIPQEKKKCTRIDRCRVHCLRNSLIKQNVVSHVVGSPEECYGSGPSDHAPLILLLVRKPQSQNISESVPKLPFRSLYLYVYLESIAQDIDLLRLPTHRRVQGINQGGSK